MIRGLYTSGWSMLADTKKMDVISNNLANVNTTGFKKDTVVFESFDSHLTKRISDRGSISGITDIGSMILGSDIGMVCTKFSPGSSMETGRSLDLSIRGSDNAFFTIGVDDGQGLKEYYTRDGSFNTDSEGRLITSSGGYVLGVDGNPVIVGQEDFSVDSEGVVTIGGIEAGRLLIKEFSDPQVLQKHGDNLLTVPQGAQEAEFSGIVSQGSLEQSNVDIVREMVDMITVTRSYEANQRIITALDETLRKAVNEVGALR